MGLNRRTAVYVVGSVLLAALLVLVAIVAFPGLVGGDDAYVVTSNSMEPTIESGDIVVTKAVPPEGIEAGDVVTFHADTTTDRGYVTHRVVEIREEDGDRYFKTKGDANDVPDEGYVPADAVQGVQHRHIPSLGYLFVFARSSVGLVALVVLPGLVLVASGGWQLLRELGYVSDREHIARKLLGAKKAATATDGETTSGSESDGRSEASGREANQPVLGTQNNDIRTGED
ncbi:S26 family signal peptidase [Natrinema mahii]|nr:S26 family signal peptidase [Natrinema mahii]